MDWLRPYRLKPSFFTGLLHLALTTIVVGACVTHFFGEQGSVHLRSDKASTLTVGHTTLSMFLWDFHVVNDSQTGAASDYVSELRLLDRSRPDKDGKLAISEGIVRMNKPLKYHGFRFCQSEYDSDGQGVVLLYNYDPWGIGITYTGYSLLLVAMIGFFFQKRSVFRAVMSGMAKRWSPCAVGVFFSALGIFVLVMTVVMTRVVTPKPPLEPVLQTPLLGIHVSVIMLAYTLFAGIMICGIVGLCVPKVSALCRQLSTLFLYPALFSLAAGIFIGAVWANMSWGRYWGWDPKETWALITMLVYAGLLHWPFMVKGKHTTVLFHIYSIVAFGFVIFTYFGVTFLLGGLHAYAGG